MGKPARKEWTSKNPDAIAAVRRIFGRKLRESRRRQGFSQVDLAEMVSVSPKTINSIEYGNSSPSFGLYVAIVRALSRSEIPFID